MSTTQSLRKLLLLFLFFGVTSKASSQIRYSILAGYSFDIFEGNGGLYKLNDSYTLGIEGEMNIRQYHALSIGLYYLRSGYGYEDDYLLLQDGSMLNNLVVLPFEYRLLDINRMFCLTLGIDTRFLAHSEMSEYILRFDESGSPYNEEYSMDVTKYMKRIQPLATIGMTANFRRLKFKLRYAFGLGNTYADDLSGNIPFTDSESYYISNAGGKIRESSIQIFVGFQF